MSEMVRLELSHEEATVALMLVMLGTDAYTGSEPDFEAIDTLNRLPGKHMRSLDVKLKAMAGELGAKNGSE